MESIMVDYIESNIYTMSMLLDLANIKENDADAVTFEDLSLLVLVGMYCSPGLQFAAQPFKTDLEKCSIRTINALKMYKALQSLSKLATTVNDSRIALATPELTRTPSDNDEVTNIGLDEEINDQDATSIDLRDAMQESTDGGGDNEQVSSQLENDDFLAYIVRTEKV